MRNLIDYLKLKVKNKSFLFISVILALVSTVSWYLHYNNIFYGNPITWTSWLLAILFLFLSFTPNKLLAKIKDFRISRKFLLISFFITALYFISHLWNFNIAPWNQNGLFDDAAWDIYFANNHAFNGVFQPAFFDEVGNISREVVFHYYITIFFKLFGYNLLVFNISLLILGFITVFFTSLIVHRLFKNTIITLISAIIINFFPFHFMHIFMGHRYAIAAPLMVVSLYFLYQAFLLKSFWRAVISAIFAFLCWDSAVMGKQYLLGLIISAPLVFAFSKKSKENLSVAVIWTITFIISSIPLLTYIYFNYDNYVIREKGLFSNFISTFNSDGFTGIKPYVTNLMDIFFSKVTFSRQFLHDYYLIPLVYYLLLVPGILVAILKKRIEIAFLAVIPIVATFFSGAYDFRVLLAVPLWVICIAYSLNLIFNFHIYYKHHLTRIFFLITIIILSLGLISSIDYILNVSRNPHHQYLLPHKDVAVSRIVQDIVVGNQSPTIEMKTDEFNRNKDISKVSYQTRVCPYSSYAIMHLYLQEYDDKKILSFCNQGIQLLKSEKEILDDNLNAIELYNDGKDLKMIWEASEKSMDIIKLFKNFESYGYGQTIQTIQEGQGISLYILTINKENLDKFKKSAESLRDLSLNYNSHQL